MDTFPAVCSVAKLLGSPRDWLFHLWQGQVQTCWLWAAGLLLCILPYALDLDLALAGERATAAVTLVGATVSRTITKWNERMHVRS